MGVVVPSSKKVSIGNEMDCASGKPCGEGDKTIEVQLSVHLDPEVIKKLPLLIAQKFNVLPVARIDDCLVLASDSQLTPRRVEELSQAIGEEVLFIPASIVNLRTLLKQVYGQSEKQLRIGEILNAEGLISEEQLLLALEKQQTEPRKLGQILLDLGFLSQEELGRALETQARQGSPSVDPYLYISSQTLDVVSESVARRYEILPLARSRTSLVLFSARFLDSTALEELKAITGLTPKPLLVDAGDLKQAIDSCFKRRSLIRKPQIRLGELLQSRGSLTEEQLNVCLKKQKATRERLGDVIIKLGFASEDTVYSCLAEQLGCEYRNFSVAMVDVELAQMVSQKFAERHRVVPISLERREGVLEVAMAEPNDLKVKDLLKSVADEHGYKLKAVLSSPASITTGIAYIYNVLSVVNDQVEIEQVFKMEESRRDLTVERDMPEIRRILNQVLYAAVVEAASDIHIENLEDQVRVRFRVDGILQERTTAMTKDNIEKVVSVLKLDSGLDVTERRRPQDGVFKMRVEKERFVDFRINIHANAFGQDAVIRILDPVRNLLPLDKLGLPDQILKSCYQLIENPQGLMLITGPTGSGKSTTLYSMLNHLNRGDKKIITAEDPVEYYLRGISQYQVNEAIGNTFTEYAHRFLRKDPDIILIGEVRDEQTAVSCLKAAMTGHLVFSTLHTNDSVGALVRLLNLGVEPNSIADSLLAVVSQRLVRRICAQCREIDHPDSELLACFYPQDPPQGVQFKKGLGCSACGKEGYRGRVGLYEMWEMTEDVRKLISKGVGEREIRHASHQGGCLRPLMEDALEKVHSGVTTLEELRRVVPLEQIRDYLRLGSVGET